MRKRTILALVAILIIASIAKATPVDPQQAIQVAQQFVPKSTAQRAPMRGSRTDPSSSIVYTHMMPNSDRPAFYIVNVDDGAFVLVSADDIAHQVLGYSLNSTWPVSKDGSVELPEHIKGFFDDLAAQMEAAVETEPTRAAGSYKASQSSSTPNRSPSLPDSVGPLLTTTWNQGQYYNALCPEDANGPDGHVYTGCVATAMAQIVKYWSDSTPGRGTHSYSTNYGTLTVNYAEASYDYANMPDVLDANSTQTQIDAVAQLIYHCGVATNMDYSFNESSSYDIDARAGLINFFRFSPDLSYAEKATFSNDEWNNLLIEELVSNRPVLYSGHGNAGGHCFVCDGYKSNNYYHFNFGWGGMADGWYLTNSVNPSGIGFNSSQTALIGIMPDTTKNVILSQMAGNSYFVVDKPIELYHLLGHNKYKGLEYNNPCNSTITFYLTDTTKSVVLDVMKYDNQGIVVYDGLESFSDPVRTFWGSDYSKDPFVSSKSAITLKYDGALVYDGFRFHIGENNSYRMVSNIDVSVESNSVSLKWNENGTATSWKVEYGLKGFQLNHGVSQIVSTPFFTVDSLNSFSEYDFYISPIYEDYCAPFNLIAVTILAPYWHNVVTKQPLGYSNIDDIVEISTAEELTWWANHDIEKSAKLIKDIDLGDYLWKPIKYYNGHFDGNCHIIKNMHINENDQDIGFISELTGVVENLGMSNCEVKGTYRIGTLCGLQRGTLLNCFVKGGHVAGIDEIGGLIGNTYYGTTINCYANTNVSGYMNGILVGKSETKSLIQNCYAYGTMVADDLRWNGSISAYAHAGTINHCYGTDTYNNIVGYKGSAIISDTSLIRYDARTSQWQLNNPIQLDGVYDSDLLCVLNKGVTALNDSRLRLWIEDSEGINDGLPVFGGFYND